MVENFYKAYFPNKEERLSNFDVYYSSGVDDHADKILENLAFGNNLVGVKIRGHSKFHIYDGCIRNLAI